MILAMTIQPWHCADAVRPVGTELAWRVHPSGDEVVLGWKWNVANVENPLLEVRRDVKDL